MQQVPNTNKKKGTGGYFGPVANIKRDINLLPTNENSQKMARIGTFGLLIFVGVVLVVLLAIVLPQYQLNSTKVQADAMSAQATTEARLSGKYDMDLAAKKELQGILDSLVDSSKDGKLAADMIAQVSNACPESIVVTSITFNGDGAIILGLAPDDAAIAQFITNLKTVPIYQYVGITNIGNCDKANNPTYKRGFQIVANFPPAPSTSPQPSPAPTATTKGGD